MGALLLFDLIACIECEGDFHYNNSTQMLAVRGMRLPIIVLLRIPKTIYSQYSTEHNLRIHLNTIDWLIQYLTF